jgi:hypothetical protein
VRLELTHFPVDAGYASVVAQEVDAATGTGILLPTGLSGVTCDINSDTDTSVPADTSLDPSAWDLPDLGAFDFQLSGLGEFGLGDPGVNNPEDGLNNQESGAGNGITGGTGSNGTYQTGDTLSYNPGCEGAFIEWRLVDDATGEYTIVSSGVAATYLVAAEAAAAGKSIVGVGKCPDPSAPNGYGPEIISEPIAAPPEWNEITQTGTFSVTFRQRDDVTTKYFCGTTNVFEAASNTLGNPGNAITKSNVTGWKSTGPAITEFICSGPCGLQDGAFKNIGIVIRYANGTTELIAPSNYWNGTYGSSCFGWYAVSTITAEPTITVGGVQIYP